MHAFASLIAVVLAATPPPPDWTGEEAVIAAKIDEITGQHWRDKGVTPSPLADDATFLRRVTLDLVGRTPTASEARAFLTETGAEKRITAIRKLTQGPEFPLHLGNVLDDLLRGAQSGDGEFLAYLRDSTSQKKAWEDLFREIMLGPWDTPESKRAERFLLNRLQNPDQLVNDTSRVFFGVDISCAKCHDHPLVDDWKQAHYFGLASFLNRTFEFKAKDARQVGEKEAGDLEFVDREGARHKAELLFLSGRVVSEPAGADDDWKKRRDEAEKAGQYLAPPFSRRERLVQVALDERNFFHRSIVNRVWAYLLGRGLVQPVDQMHSANPPAIPAALAWLAEDFASHGGRLDRLFAGICASQVYQLSSEPASGAPRPAPELFAVAALRPLSPRQFAISTVMCAGSTPLEAAAPPEDQVRQYQENENRAQALVDHLDPRIDDFQSSATEALFVSNNGAVQSLLAPDGENLAARAGQIADDCLAVDELFWNILARPPRPDEEEHLRGWLAARSDRRQAAISQLAWALLASAEFRFNH